MEHVEISASQKAAANKKFQELMAAEKPEEPIEKKPAEGEQSEVAEGDDTATGDAGEKVQEEKVESETEEKAPEKKDEKKAAEIPAEEEVVDEPPTDEADAIAAQEALLNEAPPKKEKGKDKTPIEERAEFKKYRLQIKEERARIEALEKTITELKTQAPVTDQTKKPETGVFPSQAVTPTPAEVEAQIAALDKDWNDGKFPTMDYAQLEAEKTALRAEARVMAKITAQQKERDERSKADVAQKEQEATTARIDKELAKAETFLPGVKDAFLALVKDPVIGPDPIIGQAIMQNLDKGGLHVAFYLKHHRDYAVSLTELPVDERAAKLYDLRQKLTRPKKTAVKPTDFKPDKPIVNSHIPEKGEKEKNKSSDSEVEAEIQKARKNRR